MWGRSRLVAAAKKYLFEGVTLRSEATEGSQYLPVVANLLEISKRYSLPMHPEIRGSFAYGSG
jgi:hypothetical protein